MVQSLHEKALAEREDWLSKVTLAVIDEAHAAYADSYAKMMAALSRARVLGLTATPFRTSCAPSSRITHDNFIIWQLHMLAASYVGSFLSWSVATRQTSSNSYLRDEY